MLTHTEFDLVRQAIQNVVDHAQDAASDPFDTDVLRALHTVILNAQTAARVLQRRTEFDALGNPLPYLWQLITTDPRDAGYFS